MAEKGQEDEILTDGILELVGGLNKALGYLCEGEEYDAWATGQAVRAGTMHEFWIWKLDWTLP